MTVVGVERAVRPGGGGGGGIGRESGGASSNAATATTTTTTTTSSFLLILDPSESPGELDVALRERRSGWQRLVKRQVITGPHALSSRLFTFSSLDAVSLDAVSRPLTHQNVSHINDHVHHRKCTTRKLSSHSSSDIHERVWRPTNLNCVPGALRTNSHKYTYECVVDVPWHAGSEDVQGEGVPDGVRSARDGLGGGAPGA